MQVNDSLRESVLLILFSLRTEQNIKPKQCNLQLMRFSQMLENPFALQRENRQKQGSTWLNRSLHPKEHEQNNKK